MDRGIHAAWLKLINVKKEESTTVGYFFLHHFFLGLGLALFFTVAGTFFLANFSADYFPMVFMLSALTMMVAGRVYNYFEHHINIKELLLWVVLLLVGLALLFRIAFGITQLLVLPILLMIGFRIFYLLINLEFWGISALVFDVRQSKRLFGLISSGDIPAKLLGYASVYTLVPYINLENLLVIAAISFLVSYHFLRQIFKRTEVVVKHQHSHATKFSDKKIIQTYFGNDFIMSVAILAFLIMATFTLIDYVFLSSVQSQYETEKELASFLSIFFTIGYTFTLIFKSILSGRFSDKVGLKKSLLVMPIILLLFSAVFLFYGTTDINQISNLIFIGIMTMVMGVLKYSINDPVFLVLFQPLQPHLRLKGHSVIKGLVQPVALGVIGLLLWLIQYFNLGTNFYYLNFALFIILLLWIISVSVANKKYLQTLSHAIRKRFIAGSSIAVRDKNYYNLLIEKLKSNHVQEVLYAISVLNHSNPDLLKHEIRKLVKHKDEAVIANCINAIIKNNWNELNEELYQIYNSNKKENIRGLAIKAYCHSNENAFNKIKEDLFKTTPAVKRAIIAGLITGKKGQGKVEAEKALQELIVSNNIDDKVYACEVIEEIGSSRYYKPLLQFLNDKNESLNLAAIRATANVRHQQLVEKLFELLHLNKFKKSIIFSLSHFENISQEINKRVRPVKVNDISILNSYIKILDIVKDDMSIELLQQLSNYKHADIRTNVLASLSKITKDKTQKFNELFNKSLKSEFSFAYKLVHAINDENNDPVVQALQLELGYAINRIFLLLGLLYNRELVKKAEAALQLANRESKANAVEILDHVIPKRLHQCIVALVENSSHDEKLNKLKAFNNYVVNISEDIICEANNQYSNWTIAVALNADLYSDNMLEHVYSLVKHKEKLISQCAAEAIKRRYNSKNPTLKSIIANFDIDINMILNNKDKGRLSELEKVIILKSTALFSDTPENVIAEIAAIVTEVLIAKNVMIFKKGDPGSSMYIIYDGEIRIHDGEKTFAILQSLNFFGELALLDPEPRSATATATKDTFLLRIDQDSAYELMDDRGEVLKSMMRILCRRIRKQNEKLASALSD